MPVNVRTYRADPELAQLIEGAARGELELQISTGEDSYDVYVADVDTARRRETSHEQFAQRRGIWTNYDVKKVRAALAATQGILDGVDVDALIQQIRDERHDDRWDASS